MTKMEAALNIAAQDDILSDVLGHLCVSHRVAEEDGCATEGLRILEASGFIAVARAILLSVSARLLEEATQWTAPER